MYIAEVLGVSPQTIPQTRVQNAAGFATLHHHLVATDALVAAQCALGASLEVHREEQLRRALRAQAPMPSVVSDGAFTVLPPHAPRPMTFHLEVVRADVRGGNRSLRRKFDKYVSLLRRGFFERAYGQIWIRAVCIATTTATRAAHLRRLASDLAHGRRLFWFSAYERQRSGGPPQTVFTPERFLDHEWIDGTGERQTLRQTLQWSA